MKKLLLAFALILSTAYLAEAQGAKLDASPMDATYLRPGRGQAPIAKVVYSRPQKKDRQVFGNLVKFDEVWRTGANENTEIRFYTDVKFGGKTIEAGIYSLFSIPGEDEWTVIINKDTDIWGHYNYNEDMDVLRITVPSQSTPQTVEAFTIAFDKKEGVAHMIMAWDDTMVAVPVE